MTTVEVTGVLAALLAEAFSEIDEELANHSPDVRRVACAEAAINIVAAHMRPPRLWTPEDIADFRSAVPWTRPEMAKVLSLHVDTLRSLEGAGRPLRRPRPLTSSALDYALGTAPPEVRARFAEARALRRAAVHDR